MSHDTVAYSMGLVSIDERIKLLKKQLDVQQHVYAGQWTEAWHARSDLLAMLAKVRLGKGLVGQREDCHFVHGGTVFRVGHVA